MLGPFRWILGPLLLLQLSSYLGVISFDLNDPLSNNRLPNATVPILYTVAIVPYEEQLRFTGNTEIRLSVLNQTDTITLHSSGLRISRLNVTDPKSIVVHPILEFLMVNDLDLLIIKLKDPLKVGLYNLQISYDGDIEEFKKGLVRTFYYSDEGERRYIIYTQLETIFARSVFPCFDEPQIKAEFIVRVAHFPNRTVTSNMPAVSTSIPDQDIGNRTWTTFQKTPRMSTYLVNFVLSDFSNYTNSAKNLTIWTRPNVTKDGTKILEFTESVLNHLSKKLDLHETEVPKIDVHIIPDCVVGAMENWGSIVQHELIALSDRSVIKNFGAQKSTIHGIAHTWFGNTVTPAGWNHLWVSEGLVKFLEFLVLDYLQPSIEALDIFSVEYMINSLNTQVYNTILKIDDNEANAELELSAITNEKATCIIAMLYDIIGDDVFYRGLKSYITENYLANVVPTNFYQALQSEYEVSEGRKIPEIITIQTIMDGWVKQPGFPLVTIIRDYEKSMQTISQERYLERGSELLWWIPFHCTSRTFLNFGSKNETIWLSTKRVKFFTDSYENDDWIICNTQQKGYYRVNYDTRNWRLLIEHLNSDQYKEIDVRNRAQLIDDVWNLATSEYLDIELALDLFHYLRRETDYLPWKAALMFIIQLNQIMSQTSDYHIFKSYISWLIESSEKSLTYEEQINDTLKIRKQRNLVWQVSCLVGNVKCREKAKAITLEYYKMNNPKIFSSYEESKATVLCEGMKLVNSSVWEFYLEKSNGPQTESSKSQLMQALACTTNKTVFEYYLDLLYQNMHNSWHTDFALTMIQMYNNLNMLDVLLEFSLKNYKAIKDYTNVDFFLENYYSISSNKTQSNKVKQFIKKNYEKLGYSKTEARLIIDLINGYTNPLLKYKGRIGFWMKRKDLIKNSNQTNSPSTASCITGTEIGILLLSAIIVIWI